MQPVERQPQSTSPPSSAARRWTGRHRLSPDEETEIVHVRVPKSKFDIMVRKAQRLDMCLSEYLRDVLHRYA